MLHPRLRAAAGNRGGIPTDGLISHWTMDNISGSTLIDDVSGNNGTISGATQVAGRFGQALSFDGNDQVSMNYGVGVTFAISLWLKSTQTGLGFMYDQSGSPTLSTTRSVYLSSGMIVFQTRDSGGTGIKIESASGYNDGAYHHVVAMEDSNNFYLCIDDVLIGSQAKASSYGFVSSGFLGRRRPAAVYYYVGHLDQIRLYNRILTEPEISALATEV